MREGEGKQFSSPEEEIQFLRAQIAEREAALQSTERTPERTAEVARGELEEYQKKPQEEILKPERRLDEGAVTLHAEVVSGTEHKIDEILKLAQEKGIHNALTVLQKTNDAHLIDEVHRTLIEHIRGGKEVQQLKEGEPLWQVLHMTLFEVTLPEALESGGEKTLSELMGMMMQFYAGMQNVGGGDGQSYYTFEIAEANESDDIVFYVAVPRDYVGLFEKQILSLFPNAILTEQVHDYNIFAPGGYAVVSEATLKRFPIYPLKTFDEFESDPLAVLLNAFSKIDRVGGAALQICIKTPKVHYQHSYEGVIEKVRKGMSAKEAISRSSFGGELMATFGETLFGKTKKPGEEEHTERDTEALEQFSNKIKDPIVECTVRIVASARTEELARNIVMDIEATFTQFENTGGNRFLFRHLRGASLQSGLRAFSFREFNKKSALPLSLRELTTVIHFTGNGIESSPQFKQSNSKTAPAPTEMPETGTHIGTNKHRGLEKEIYMTAEDRLRHLYIIGQTGTGKSVYMKNLVIQDIRAGAGVCYIDPHGSDIQDVLGLIPPERADDVIYFDPSRLDQVIGLNILEYDEDKPEQKTFVINELFSIFQKLYGANPESMGPMFEQYFRNATALVLEDPLSGSTMMDIGRVMANPNYRQFKLQYAKNPVVVQFWNEIASKAGGEASLENIVPYITSKFDVFTANDYMRPIIGQQHSSFNFREVMDTNKILLVNLSKGRLGEINANLIGMIIVGKLLMAALSRVDDQSKSFPPFYLHMDEFQNISTPAIASILSEARKYKLGLTVAHQFIAQLDEKIRDAIFGNVGSMTAFRVGSEDAEALVQQFDPVFDANDLMNIPNRNAYVKMLANGTPTKPFSVSTVWPGDPDEQVASALIQHSMSRYGRPRAEVEAEISERYMVQAKK